MEQVTDRLEGLGGGDDVGTTSGGERLGDASPRAQQRALRAGRDLGEAGSDAGGGLAQAERCDGRVDLLSLNAVRPTRGRSPGGRQSGWP